MGARCRRRGRGRSRVIGLHATNAGPGRLRRYPRAVDNLVLRMEDGAVRQCAEPNEEELIGSRNDEVAEGLTGLQPGTVYHYRIVAHSRGGAGKSDECSPLLASFVVLLTGDPLRMGRPAVKSKRGLFPGSALAAAAFRHLSPNPPPQGAVMTPVSARGRSLALLRRPPRVDVRREHGDGPVSTRGARRAAKELLGGSRPGGTRSTSGSGW